MVSVAPTPAMMGHLAAPLCAPLIFLPLFNNKALLDWNEWLYMGQCCCCLRDFKIISFICSSVGEWLCGGAYYATFYVSEILLSYAESSGVVCFLLSLDDRTWGEHRLVFFFLNFRLSCSSGPRLKSLWWLRPNLQSGIFSIRHISDRLNFRIILFVALQLCLVEWLKAAMFQRLFHHFWTQNGTPKIRLFSLANRCKVDFTESILGFYPPLKVNPNNQLQNSAGSVAFAWINVSNNLFGNL